MEVKIKERIENSIEENTHIIIKKFLEPFVEINNDYLWDDKTKIIGQDFVDLIQNSKSDELELHIVAVGALVQFCWNLIKDFDIYSQEGIPTYCSGYHYVSKLKNHKEILSDLGYVKKEKVFEMKTENFNNDKAMSYLIQCIIAYSELIELKQLSRKVKVKNVDVDGLIQMRRNNLDELKNRELIISKCGLCENPINLNTDTNCSGCEESIEKMNNIRKHAQYVNKTYNLNIEPLEDENDENEAADEHEPMNGEVYDCADTWNCRQCTFTNKNTSNNCEVCEGEK